MHKYDVVIIGSGISGMSAALLFAKKGKKVLIVEQASNIAPLFAGFDRKGVHFETGFHYSGSLGKGEIGDYLFKELGVQVPVELCDEDEYDELRLVESKQVFKMPIGRDKVLKRFTELFPDEKEGMEKYINLIEDSLDKVPFLNIHKKAFKDEDLLVSPYGDKTLNEVLDECFKSEKIKTILSFPSMLYGTPPDKASFVFHCCCSGIMFKSAWKIKGGAMSLVNAFTKTLKEKNVDIFLNKKAVKIEVDSEKKKIYFSDDSCVVCDICVSTIHPKEFIKIAPEGTYRDKNIERIKNIDETSGALMLYGVLRNGVRYKNTNITTLTKGNLRGDFNSLMYINFSDSDPQAVCVVSSISSADNLWDISKEQYVQKKKELVKNLKERLNKDCFDIIKDVEFLDTSTPKTFKRYLGYYGTYGTMHRVNGMNVLPITKTPGLFVIGQASVTPGLLGAMFSAFLLDKIIGYSKS